MEELLKFLQGGGSFRLALLGGVFVVLAIFILLILSGVSFGSVAYSDQSLVGNALLAVAIVICLALGMSLIRIASRDDHGDVENQRPVKEIGESSYDRVFELCESIEFFDIVSLYYDQRTSKQRDQSNDLIHSFCQSHFSDLKGKKIADLGGGTGVLLKKFRHHQVFWVNIDNSDKAIEVFESKFTKAGNITARSFDICSGSYQLDAERFDILILNFVLSTVPGQFPFGNLVRLMHKNSLLIVADNYGAYAKGRLYGFKDVSGNSYALRVKPIETNVLLAEARNAGLVHVDTQFVYTDNDKIYSQVLSFRIPEGG